jgi:zinc D-Ala-D-Ala carboxypeptidase
MTMFFQSWRDVPPDKWRWKNFSPREMACKGTGQLLIDEVAMDNLQKLRDTLGRPLIVVSAYRSPEHNRKVGGAPNSYHLKGCAFDIRMDNHHPWEFELAAKAAGFRGFGYYAKTGFMHIDMGPTRTWGIPFKSGDTKLVMEPEARASMAESTTIQASAVQLASGAGAGFAALGALEGTAQIVVLGLLGVVLLATLWIIRERVKKWVEGVK